MGLVWFYKRCKYKTICGYCFFSCVKQTRTKLKVKHTNIELIIQFKKHDMMESKWFVGWVNCV